MREAEKWLQLQRCERAPPCSHPGSLALGHYCASTVALLRGAQPALHWGRLQDALGGCLLACLGFP